MNQLKHILSLMLVLTLLTGTLSGTVLAAAPDVSGDASESVSDEATAAEVPAKAQLFISASQSEAEEQLLSLDRYAYFINDNQYLFDETLELSTYLNKTSSDAVFTIQGGQEPSAIYIDCLTDLDGNGNYERLISDHTKATPIGELIADDVITAASDTPVQLLAGESRAISAAALLQWGLSVERSRASTGPTIKDLTPTTGGDLIFCFSMQQEGQDHDVYYVRIDPTPIDDESVKTLGAVIYTDVPSWSWYWEAVDHCTRNGLLSGTGGSSFSPAVGISRAMLVQVLYNWEGKPNTAASLFDDVSPNDWYFSSTSWAAKNGIVSGYEDATFHPDQALTREQMAVIFYQYSSKWDMPPVSGDLSQYSDADSVSPWAYDAMNWAINSQLFSARDTGMLDPAGPVSRAELASVLYTLNKKIATPTVAEETPDVLSATLLRRAPLNHDRIHA